MDGFHSTVGRREFMKALGLGTFGLGATAATAPAFHDLDELVSSSPDTEVSHPWWVKQREHGNPTIEVDYDLLAPSFACITGLDGFGYPGPYPGYFVHKDSPSNPIHMDQSKPGFRMEDYALMVGSFQVSLHDHSFDLFLGAPPPGPQTNNEDPHPDAWPDWGWPETPKYKQIPRWSGTPEEATRIVRAAAHHYGAFKVGFLAVDDKVKKLEFADSLIWEDCDKPYYKEAVLPRGPVLGFPEQVKGMPNKMKSVIVIQLTQPYDTTRLLHNPKTNPAMGPLNVAAFGMGYHQRHIVTRRLQSFLHVMGFLGSSTNFDINTGAGALSGLNEIGRHGLGISPELGSAYRVNVPIFTDLAVSPSSPIDAGLARFCETCGVCAEICPNEAIYKPKEPTWELPSTELGRPEHGIPAGTKNTWTRPGVKHWPVDYVRCKGCSYCQGYCTFSQMNSSSIHNLIKSTVSNSSVFNSFLANGDRLFGYNNVNSDFDGWWNRNLDTYPGDMNYAKTIGH